MDGTGLAGHRGGRHALDVADGVRGGWAYARGGSVVCGPDCAGWRNGDAIGTNSTPGGRGWRCRAVSGRSTAVQSSGEELGPGTYVLAVRLRQAYLEAAVIPVLKVEVAETGGHGLRGFCG